MIADIDLQDLDAVDGAAPVSQLQAVQAKSMTLAAQSLRDLQAWAAAYAVMLETGGVGVDDLLSADAALWAATTRAGEALKTFGAAFSCEGMA